MGLDFKLDAKALKEAMKKSPEAAGDAAKTTLTDIKNDWKAEAVDIAPIDTSNLRKQISADVINPGMDGYIEIFANATRPSSGKWKRFNYAYYIHEDKGKVQAGEKKFLDVSAEQNTDKWQRWLEEEVEKELRKAGW